MGSTQQSVADRTNESSVPLPAVIMVFMTVAIDGF